VKGYMRRHRTFTMLAQQCLYVARRSYSLGGNHNVGWNVRSQRERPMTLTGVWGAFVLCVLANELLQVAVCRGSRHGSGGRSASERKIRTWFPRRQPRSMRLAVRMRSANAVFLSVIIHF
jgi:hypothetical protein